MTGHLWKPASDREFAVRDQESPVSERELAPARTYIVGRTMNSTEACIS